MSDEETPKPCSGHCMESAWLCTYFGFDCNNIEICYRFEGDCLCIRHGSCCSVTAPNKGIGMVTNEEKGEICKVGFFCCDLGLVKPQTCCSNAESCLCCYQVCSLPFSEEYLDKCVCGCCFLQCFPKFGCALPPPACPALDKLRATAGEVEAMVMDRDDDAKKDEEPAKEAEETPAAEPEPEPVKAEAKVIEGEDKEIDM